jgi:hypothetical protein
MSIPFTYPQNGVDGMDPNTEVIQSSSVTPSGSGPEGRGVEAGREGADGEEGKLPMMAAAGSLT